MQMLVEVKLRASLTCPLLTLHSQVAVEDIPFTFPLGPRSTNDSKQTNLCRVCDISWDKGYCFYLPMLVGVHPLNLKRLVPKASRKSFADPTYTLIRSCLDAMVGHSFSSMTGMQVL